MATMTPQQFEDYLARQPGAQVAPSDAPDRPESFLHEQIMDYCEVKSWIYFHGSMAHRTRRTKAEPDFHIWADRGRKFAFECKRPGGKLSEEQARLRGMARWLGHEIHVVTSLAEFVAVVEWGEKCHS